jgi:hypothetical protein
MEKCRFFFINLVVNILIRLNVFIFFIIIFLFRNKYKTQKKDRKLIPFQIFQESENQENPEIGSSPQSKKNEKALLARLWGNFDSR